LAAYSVLVMGASPTAFRFGHFLPDSSIVQRLTRLTHWFSRHMLMSCPPHTLGWPCLLLPFGNRELPANRKLFLPTTTASNPARPKINCVQRSAKSAPGIDCGTEAKVLSQSQSELPRLDVASPADRPPYCITLETLMAFARRVKDHLPRCPNSELAAGAADWSKTQSKTQADYSRLFARHRCKRTM
jgi:hypothetical protein